MEDVLAEEIIKNELTEGDTIELILDTESNLLKANITKPAAPVVKKKKKEES